MAVTGLPQLSPKHFSCNPTQNLKLILNHDDNLIYTHSGTFEARETLEKDTERLRERHRQTD